MILLLLSPALLGTLVTGCDSTPATVGFKTVVATDAGVRATMIGWGAYVAARHPSTNDELRVKNAFSLVKQAELTALDATEALTTDPTATNAVQDAQDRLAGVRVDLLSLINSITNHP